jgi:hypothetical protein
MPPLVAILASVVVLLVALAVILPVRSEHAPKHLPAAEPAPPAPNPGSPEAAPGVRPEELEEATAALGRAERLEVARGIWAAASRTHAQAKLVLALGITGIVGAGCAYGGIQAALEQDWPNALVLFIASGMLAWGTRRAWSRLQTLRNG